jgi:hypothetical protein
VLNEILNDNEQKLRQDIYSFARILNLMIHFELENYQLIEYSANSTLRYLKKIDRNYNIEAYFVKQIKKISKNINENSTSNFDELKNGLDEYLKDDKERVILDYIDIVSWTSSKVEGISFEDAVKRK